MFEIIFLPERKVVRLARGGMLSQAITKANLSFDFPCGGQGKCGKCKVRIVKNCPPPTHADRMLLSQDELQEGVRIACQTRVESAMEIELLNSSGQHKDAQILTDSTSAAAPQEKTQDDRPLEFCKLDLPNPSLEDDKPDVERVQTLLGPVTMSLDMVRRLPEALRSNQFKVQAVVYDNHLLDILPETSMKRCLGVAFDIGTTTLVAALLDAATGETLSVTSSLNPQTRFGDDVISRIQRVRETHEGLPELHRSIILAINEMIEDVCAKAGQAYEDIYLCVFSGNTTMLHLLLGVSPAALGELPFTPVMRQSLNVAASELGLRTHPNARAITLPIIGGFVGGDTVAGILTSGIAEATSPTMLVDIGTNGEIALKHQNKLSAASCAAGPAFEGATISHGMRAAIGAIEEISIDTEVHCKTIGNVAPIGICGSALIDLTAELLRLGILSFDGTLLTESDIPANVPDEVRKRACDFGSGPEFVVVSEEQSGTGKAISVTHRDFRALQLATAAIRAGMAVLLAKSGLTPADLDKLLVAGAFGNYIRPHNAQRMGLLPHDLAPNRIQFMGNSSLAGAQAFLLSKKARTQADIVARSTEHVELSRDPNFMTSYVESMFFPSENSL